MPTQNTPYINFFAWLGILYVGGTFISAYLFGPIASYFPNASVLILYLLAPSVFGIASMFRAQRTLGKCFAVILVIYGGLGVVGIFLLAASF